MKLSQQDCMLIRSITDELDCKLVCHYKHENQACIAIKSECLLTVLSLFFMAYIVREKKTVEDGFNLACNEGYELAAALYQIDENTAIFKDLQWYR